MLPRKRPATTRSSLALRASGRAGSMRTSPVTSEGASVASASEIMPPIELPTRITGPDTTSVTNRCRRRRLAWTLGERPASGVRP